MTQPRIINLDRVQQADSGIFNQQTGLGIQGYDSLVRSQFESSLMIQPENFAFLSRLYRSCWQIQKVCSYFPDEMTKNWGEVNISTDLDLELDTQNKINELKDIFRDGQTYANLYGGALYVRFVEDGKDLDQPVDWSKAKSVSYSRLYDRWELNITYNTDYITVDPYNPEYYAFFAYSPNTSKSRVKTGQKIHSDRILRFRGVKLPPYEQILNLGWEDSVLQTFLRPLKNYLAGLGYVTEALRNFEIIILKAMDLHDALLSGNGQKIEERGRAIAQELSSMRPVMMDKSEEDAEIINRQFTGVVEIVQLAMKEMIAASGIDAGEFYQEKDQIKANSKEERLRSASRIKALQEKQWGRLIREEISHILAPYQLESSDWEWQWHSTYEQTKSEDIEDDLKISQTLKNYLEMGVISEMEIRKSIFDNANSLITLEDDTIIKLVTESPNSDAVPKFIVNGEVLPESDFDFDISELEAVKDD